MMVGAGNKKIDKPQCEGVSSTREETDWINISVANAVLSVLIKYYRSLDILHFIYKYFNFHNSTNKVPEKMVHLSRRL